MKEGFSSFSHIKLRAQGDYGFNMSSLLAVVLLLQPDAVDVTFSTGQT